MELKFDIENPQHQYITNHEDAQKALEDLEKHKILAVDIEANSLDPFTGDMFLVQIGKEDLAYIFDVRKVNLNELPNNRLPVREILLKCLLPPMAILF